MPNRFVSPILSPAQRVFLLGALLLLAVGGCTGGSSGEKERVYGTPVDPDELQLVSGDASLDSRLNDIARCLASRGAALYGSSGCPATRKQKNSFGDAMRHIPYIECPDKTEMCDSKGIEWYPTWIIGDVRIVGYRPPETLADLTGCE